MTVEIPVPIAMYSCVGMLYETLEGVAVVERSSYAEQRKSQHKF